MDNKQIAHDLAIAYMAGKQLPPEVLVDEYYKNYEIIYSCLKSRLSTKSKISVLKKSDLGVR